MTDITRTKWDALPVGYLSPSQVWAYVQCPACYEAERILKIPKPVSADLMIGRFAHAALADMRAQLVENAEVEERDQIQELPINPDRSLEVGSAAFDEVITRQVDVDEEGDETPIELELTKKFTDLGQAKDAAVRLTRYVLPIIARYDRVAGVLAAEARVWHLGPSFHGYPDLFRKLNPDEAADAEEESREQFVDGVQPVFPFPFKAILDVVYANGWLKDLKTASKQGSPDMLASLQLLTYDLPFWLAGERHKLAWDVAIKTKNPDFATYYLNDTGDVTDEQYEYARDKTMWVADQICAGNFPVNEGGAPWSHKYIHSLPTGTRAAMEDWSIPA